MHQKTVSLHLKNYNIMGKVLFFSLLALHAATTFAQDVFQAEKGDITIYPVNHASLVITWNGIAVYVDPHGDASLFANLPKPDLVLVTDIHQDHLDVSTLQALDMEKAFFVVPEAVEDKLPDAFKGEVATIYNGGRTVRSGIEIEAVPMYNLPEEEGAFHPRGRGNGYVLTLGGERIYISGDTEDIKEMRELEDIDIAFVCMNLPYTMTVDQAASAVLDFEPDVVYPYHFRGKDGMSDVGRFKNLVQDKSDDIEVRLRKWYPDQK